MHMFIYFNIYLKFNINLLILLINAFLNPWLDAESPDCGKTYIRDHNKFILPARGNIFKI